MSHDRLTELLSTPQAIDGGLATQLEAQGADLSGSLWSARLLADDPDAVREAHRAYVRAGARVLITASYQASRAGFIAAGMDAADADSLMAASVRLAREAVDAERPEVPVLVAASVGPYGAIRHDGSEYVGRYGLSHKELVDFHRERIEVLVAAGPDLLAVETIPDVDEAAAIVEVLADHPDVPAWIAFSCKDEMTCSGQPFDEAVAVAVSAPSVRAVGVNCTAPSAVAGLLRAGAVSAGDLPFVVYPNAGRVWDGVASAWLGEGGDRLPSAAVSLWTDLGARLIGGCCGLGPAAVQDIAVTLAGR